MRSNLSRSAAMSAFSTSTSPAAIPPAAARRRREKCGVWVERPPSSPPRQSLRGIGKQQRARAAADSHRLPCPLRLWQTQGVELTEPTHSISGEVGRKRNRLIAFLGQQNPNLSLRLKPRICNPCVRHLLSYTVPLKSHFSQIRADSWDWCTAHQRPKILSALES